MQIYQPFITGLCATVAQTSADTYRDFEIAALIAAQAKTIIFSADQVLALRPALERFEETVEYRQPFPQVILQFDRPIPEREFFDIEHAYQNDPDHLRAIERLWQKQGLSVYGWSPSDGDALVDLLEISDTDWRDLPMPNRRAIALYVISRMADNGNITQRAFDETRPDWMPTASAIGKMFGLNWGEIVTNAVRTSVKA